MSNIYSNDDIYTTSQESDDKSSGTDNQKLKNSGCRWYIVAAVCLLVLGFLLLIVIITLLSFEFHILTAERNQLWTSITNLTKESEKMQSIIIKLTIDKNQLQTNLTKERDQLQSKLDKMDLILVKSINIAFNESGWTFSSSSLYYISTETKSWAESRSFCNSRQADLVIINSVDEQNFLNQIMEKIGLQFWIGLSDAQTEGVWKWVDGTALTTSFWRETQPDDYRRNEDCVELYFGWNDLPCAESHRWICEIHIK